MMIFTSALIGAYAAFHAEKEFQHYVATLPESERDAVINRHRENAARAHAENQRFLSEMRPKRSCISPLLAFIFGVSIGGD